MNLIIYLLKKKNFNSMSGYGGGISAPAGMAMRFKSTEMAMPMAMACAAPIQHQVAQVNII